MSWVQGTYAIGAAIFAVVTCILFLCSNKRHISGIGPVVAMLLICALYVFNAYDYKVITRADGHVVRGAHYVFEGAALFFLFLSVPGNAQMYAAMNLAWSLLHFLSSVDDSPSVRIWGFVFGLILWTCALIAMCVSIVSNGVTTVANDKSHGLASFFVFGLSMFGFLWFVVFSVILHLAFILGQNGFGFVGEQGTAIWYLVVDAMLYIGMCFIVMYCAPLVSLVACDDIESQPQCAPRKVARNTDCSTEQPYYRQTVHFNQDTEERDGYNYEALAGQLVYNAYTNRTK